MRVLVTGAAGFIGSWVCRALVEKGHEVVALVRATSKLDNLAGLALTRAEGDVTDRASVERALAAGGRACDAVVHTAGVVDLVGRERERLYAVNVGGVENVLGAAKAAGVRRAVLTSSTAVLGGSLTPRVADESTPSNAEELGLDYFVSKRRGEEAAFRLADERFAVIALRPTVVLGPGDIYASSTTFFLPIARRKMPGYIEGGVSTCDVRDVAAAHVAALERGRAGEAYLLGGHNLRMSDLVGRIARAAGVETPPLLPYPVAYAAAAVAEGVERVTGRRMPMARGLVRSARLYTWVTSEKAERELGYRARPFEESLTDTLRFFLATGRLRPTTPELARLVAPAPSR